jgi:hypothetical protein
MRWLHRDFQFACFLKYGRDSLSQLREKQANDRSKIDKVRAYLSAI